ncbi:MAG: LpxI family protein [Magnetococcales bacterium]|nr:UDP-2,3-diacylglucosamine diphosphatase LpxI [Magnetococcales bacterium]NGZ06209.1 LpxI family protein [Magnetococcales bacterium]
MPDKTRVGLIAGSGQLPLIFARAMGRPGAPGLAAVVAHEGESDPALANHTEALLWIRLGQFARGLRFLKEQGVRDLVLVGGITKAQIWRARPDRLALQMIWKLRGLDDDQLLRAVGSELERHGFRLCSVTDYLPELLAPEGCLSRRQPTAAEWEDIRHGWHAAKGLGALDIGQGVVVRRQMVVAAEAMEGTDAMLMRAGQLIGTQRGWAGEHNAVFVKVVKPTQDLRLDLPTIGPKTLETMARAGIRVAAIEAGGAILLDPEATRQMADRHDLVLLGLTATSLERSGWKGSES